MRTLALLLGAAGALAIGVVAIERNIAQGSVGSIVESHPAAFAMLAREETDDAGEADCPELFPLSTLRDVERDQTGRIIATAFADEPSPPASAPTQMAPIS
jgi:hypothetical protein